MSKPEQRLKAAKASGELADKHQSSFRSAQQKRSTAASRGNTAAKRSASKAMFRSAVMTVVARNRELKNLSAFVATGDVSSQRNKAYFWSGDTVGADKSVTHSAMATAQHLASQNSGVTVEMTRAGKQLDNYAGHANSFQYLQERFRYVSSSNWRAPQAQRESLMLKGFASEKVDIRAEMGATLYDSLGIASASGQQHGPLARPGSAAGALWDVVSTRFARQASGQAQVIHAASKHDAYFTSATYQRSTWQTKEKPSLEADPSRSYKEHFAEDLRGQLKGLIRTSAPNWSNTGGFRANLRPQSSSNSGSARATSSTSHTVRTGHHTEPDH